MVGAAAEMIAGLHWADFETMVDLMFARRAGSAYRGSAKPRDIDLLLREQATGETAFVQVKSKASQAVLDDYLERFAGAGYDRMFFVCHSPRAP